MNKLKFEYRIALAYLLVGCLWIVFSDFILQLFYTDQLIIAKLQMYKGWFYVFVTALLFFAYLKNHLKRLRKREDELQTAIKNSEITENQYRDLYTLFRVLSDSSGDLLWAKDLNNNYIFVNKAMCNKLLSAVDTTEPIGKSDLFFAQRERNLHPDEPNWHTFGEICADTDTVVVANLKPMQFDEYGNVKNKFLFLDVHKAPMFNSEGVLIGVVGSARDVTDQKQAEIDLIHAKEQAEESQERYKSITEQSIMGVCILQDEVFKYTNKAILDIYGYTFEDINNWQPGEYLKLYAGETLKMVSEQAHKKQIGDTSQLTHYNICCKKKNGDLLWVDNYSRTITYDGRNAVLITQIDITDRILAEEKLKYNERKFRILADNTTDWESWIDENGNYVFISPSCKRISGYEPQEFFDNPALFLDIVRSDYKELIQDHHQNTISTETLHVYDFPIITKNNEEIWLEHTCIPIYDENGFFLGRRGNNRDITERIKSRKELETSAAKRKVILETAMDGLWITDSKGVLLEINDAYCQMSGYTREELLTKEIIEITDDIDRENLVKNFERIKELGQLRFERTHIRKDGTRFNVEISAQYQTFEGGQFVVFIHDITERKRIQEELRKSQKELQSFTAYLLKVRENERADVSLEIHDSVAQYLVALKMEIGLFLKNINENDEYVKSEKIRTKLSQLILQVEKTIKSTRMIMDGLMPQQLGLLGFVDSAQAHLKNYEEVHHIKCNFENPNEVLAITEEQAIMLFRVLQESLTNILKHAHANSVTVKLEQTTSLVRMEVSDDGVGFDQNSSSRTDSYGVISMKEQVKRLNGKFTISSQLNKGTILTFELPL